MVYRLLRLSSYAILLCIAFYCGCSGSSTQNKATLDGRIFVDNRTTDINFDIVVSYEDPEKGHIEETITVQPGQKEDVGKTLIKGGTKVQVTIISHKPVTFLEGVGQIIPKRIEQFSINGNIVIQVLKLNPEKSSSEAIEVSITKG